MPNDESKELNVRKQALVSMDALTQAQLHMYTIQALHIAPIYCCSKITVVFSLNTPEPILQKLCIKNLVFELINILLHQSMNLTATKIKLFPIYDISCISLNIKTKHFHQQFHKILEIHLKRREESGWVKKTRTRHRRNHEHRRMSEHQIHRPILLKP